MTMVITHRVSDEVVEVVKVVEIKLLPILNLSKYLMENSKFFCSLIYIMRINVIIHLGLTFLYES